MAGIEPVSKDWIEYDPHRKLYVSAQRMPSASSDYFSLRNASEIDVKVFNKDAKNHDVRPIDGNTPPIDRMVRQAILLSRKGKDGSSLFTGEEYIDMVLETAKSKVRGNETLASFYRKLTTGPADATVDIYEFQEILPDGYKIDLLRFNREGDLIKIDEGLKLPEEGWQLAIGRHGIPLETSREECYVKLGYSVPDDRVKGYLYIVSTKPKIGEQRIMLRGPNLLRYDGRLLDASLGGDRSLSSEDVGALRMRREIPELIEAEKEAEILRRKVESLQRQLNFYTNL